MSVEVLAWLPFVSREWHDLQSASRLSSSYARSGRFSRETLWWTSLAISHRPSFAWSPCGSAQIGYRARYIMRIQRQRRFEYHSPWSFSRASACGGRYAGAVPVVGLNLGGDVGMLLTHIVRQSADSEESRRVEFQPELRTNRKRCPHRRMLAPRACTEHEEGPSRETR